MPRSSSSSSLTLSNESAQRHASRLSAQFSESFELRRLIKSSTDLLVNYSSKRSEARLQHDRHVRLHKDLENTVALVQKVKQAALDMKVLVDAMEQVCLNVNGAIESAFPTVHQNEDSEQSTKNEAGKETVNDLLESKEIIQAEPPSPPHSSPTQGVKQKANEDEKISTRPRRNAAKKVTSLTEPRLHGKLRKGDPFTFQ